MKLTEGTKICGFSVVRTRHVEELDAVMVEMVHDKSKAQLCWMDNKETNKFFSVTFKTLPEDSTGVFHILEHSVLCGSEKYPVKEPFVELMKSSMNTFLNAMTYPDKTMFPLSSRNENDFLNLTSVYLDAVFAPALIHNPNIFYQEGWHMEVHEGTPSYKGVVFNEMKGATSSVDRRLEEEMNQLLFPNNCYQFDSGGNPAHILDLTYEQFVDTYHRYYHPSNARFFLDGDIPLEKVLHRIDSYLKQYEACDMTFSIPMQTVESREKCAYYEVSEEENIEHHSILALGKHIGTWEDRKRILAASILCDYLADSNESPLKRALLSANLAEDVEMAVMDGIAQPYLLLVVRNMADGDSEQIRCLIKDTISDLLEKGLDKEALASSINRLAFRYRQTIEPQGLSRATAAMNSWLYGGDPLMYLVYDEAIASLKQMLEGNEYAKLLQELLLQEDGEAVLHMLPSLTLGQEEQATERKRAEAALLALSEEQKAQLIKRNQALFDWQQKADTPQQLATLPRLSLEEISEMPEHTETIVKTAGDVTLLYHPVSTNGIVHISLYFPLTAFQLEELTALALLPSFFGELETAHEDAVKLQQKIKTYIGNLSFGIETFSRMQNTQAATPYFTVHASVLKENLAMAQALLAEIMLHTKLDQEERIREIILQMDEEVRQNAMGNGHSLAAMAVQSHYSAQAAVNEATGGYTFIAYVHRLARNFDTHKEAFFALCDRMQKCICKAGMVLSITASEEVSLSDLLAKLPDGTKANAERAYRMNLPMRMGIRIPSQIGFAVKGYHLSNCDKIYEGSLQVAANMISLDYLWNAIRVQGGAYGAGMSLGRSGNMLCYSYRDPSGARSLQIYDQIAAFLTDYCQNEADIEKYIISTIASIEPLQMPQEKGLVADGLWFANVTNEDRVQTRREMLKTTKQALLAWCFAFDQMAVNGAVCVVGNDDTLQACDQLIIYDL